MGFSLRSSFKPQDASAQHDPVVTNLQKKRYPKGCYPDYNGGFRVL